MNTFLAKDKFFLSIAGTAHKPNDFTGKKYRNKIKQHTTYCVESRLNALETGIFSPAGILHDSVAVWDFRSTLSTKAGPLS